MTRDRYLLITWEGGGVIPPELGLARRLIRRGHEVHVLADPTIEAEARAAGCSFTPWSTAPHAVSRNPNDFVIQDWRFSNPLQMMSVYLETFLAGPAPRWAADVEGSSPGAPRPGCRALLVPTGGHPHVHAQVRGPGRNP